MPIQIRNSDLPNLIQSDSYKFGLWTEVVSGFQALPGLVGFWPMSSVQRSTGNVYDLSGQGRTLTYNSGVGSYLAYTGLVPYFNFAGNGYLSRADETDLDVLGTESQFLSSVRGLTVGGWFFTTTLGSNAGLISKTDVDGQVSYFLYKTTSDTLQVIISSTGLIAAAVAATSTNTITANRWYFCVGRYSPSTSLSVVLNDAINTKTTSIPASIFSSTSQLNIGRTFSVNYLTGGAALCFKSANYLSDNIINGIYQRSRNLFGV